MALRAVRVSRRLDFPATSRNREPIVEVLAELWKPESPLNVLEVASGSGQHSAYFARRFPRWTFQPTDLEPAHLDSIETYRSETGENLLGPLRLDVAEESWPVIGGYDAIFAINLIHISPWACTTALFKTGKRYLKPKGAVYLYGAFMQNGQHTAPSNEAFDRGLRQQNSAWGVRCLEEVTSVAQAQGFRLTRVVEMPANNLSVLFSL